MTRTTVLPRLAASLVKQMEKAESLKDVKRNQVAQALASTSDTLTQSSLLTKAERQKIVASLNRTSAIFDQIAADAWTKVSYAFRALMADNGISLGVNLRITHPRFKFSMDGDAPAIQGYETAHVHLTSFEFVTARQGGTPKGRPVLYLVGTALSPGVTELGAYQKGDEVRIRYKEGCEFVLDK